MEKISYPDKINIFFKEIVSRVKEILNPDFILIAGSFGKGSWLYSNDTLISDFEFVFVCKKIWSLKKKNELLKELNNEFDYDINLKGYLLDNVTNKVISNYAKKSFGYIDLNFFDTFSEPVVLYSRNIKELNIKISCSEIPVWEAWRLYVNRMGDLLSLEIEDKSKINNNYLWLKIFESTADAYLIINNIYSKNIDKRIANFKEELLEKDKELKPECVNSCQWINRALNSRKIHDLSNFDISELDNKKRKDIVNSWMTYFEKVVCEEELSAEYDNNFTQNYIESKTLQKKYLEFNNHLSIQLSNILRFLKSYKSLSKIRFRFNKMSVSWRHIVLLAVSQAFEEQANIEPDFSNTKRILKQIIPESKILNIPNENLDELVYKLWKILR